MGTGSPTQPGVSARESGHEHVDGVSVHLLGAVPQAGDGTGMKDSLRENGGCSGIEGAVGVLTSTIHNTLYSAPPHRHPVGQPIVFGDLGSGAAMNLGSHSSVSNLFGLPASVYPGTGRRHL